MKLLNYLKNKSLLFASLAAGLFLPSNAAAEGEYAWPENYGGVMLQSFYWDMYYDYSTPLWIMLQNDAGELSDYFDLIWVPNSGKCSSDPSNGYNPVYWFTNHNSSFGTEEDCETLCIGVVEVAASVEVVAGVGCAGRLFLTRFVGNLIVAAYRPRSPFVGHALVGLRREVGPGRYAVAVVDDNILDYACAEISESGNHLSQLVFCAE